MNRFLKIYFLILVVFMSAYGLLSMVEASEEVVDNKKISLLKEKTIGIEFNPVFFLITAINDETYLSGSVTLYSVDRKAEISFPLYYQYEDYGRPNTTFSVDMRYRRFMGKFQEGFFVSAGARYYYEKQSLGCAGNIVLNKIGVGLGVGTRYFFPKGLFWGYSFFIGKYLTGADKFTGCTVDLPPALLIDAELLKIGYVF